MGRLFTAVAVIALSGVLPLDAWPAHVFLMVMMWSAAVACGATFRSMLRRLALFLPFVLAIALGVPATQDGGWAWDWSLTIIFRSLVAFFAGLWLVQVLPFTQLPTTLRRLGMPHPFVSSLEFMHRYSVVLWDELERLQRARRARSCRQSLWRGWTTSAQLIGELLIRAWDRAERVHRAMLARGGEAK